MASEEKQVILVRAKSFRDGKFKFKQGVPVTMPGHMAAKYEKNYYFQVRTIKQAQAYANLENRQKVNPSSLENKAVSAEDAAVGPTKKKIRKAKQVSEGEE